VELRRFLVLLSVLLIIVLALVVWFLPANEDFRVDNPSWNGARSIIANMSASPLESFADLAVLPQKATLIVVPYLEFSPVDLDKLRRFVGRGGILVLADDYGFGNQVLEHLGLKARFSGIALIDPLYYHRQKWLPQILHFIPDPITSDIQSLILNHATCLTGIEESDVLALSSTVSFLDRGGHQMYNEEDPHGPLPVISRHYLGNGQVILIADPSIFINSMQGIDDNHTLIQNLVSTSPYGIFFDQSHLPASNLRQAKTLLATIYGLLITPPGKAGLVLLALGIALIPVWYKRRDNNSNITTTTKSVISTIIR